MNETKPQKFIAEKPHVIVCEGIDDKIFLEAYLKYLSEMSNLNSELFNVFPMNGVEKMIKGMKLFKNYDNYEYMASFLFIRDADRNVERAIDSLCGNIKDIWKIKLSITGDFEVDDEGKYFGFFIFPGLNEESKYTNGTLEDLCSEIFSSSEVESEKLFSLVDNHMQAVEENTEINFRTRHKNRLHLLFGSTNKFVGDKLGDAAKKKAFDFSNDRLLNLKNKLFQMQTFGVKKNYQD